MTKFSESLAVLAGTDPSRIVQIVESLGEVEGAAFIAALHDPNVKASWIKKALAEAGIGVAQSTLSLYRAGLRAKKTQA